MTDATGTSTTAIPVRGMAPTLRSPLAPTHAALGAVLGLEEGAEFVRSYADPDRERAALGEHVGLADITVRAKIDLRGATGTAGGNGFAIAEGWTLLLLPPGPVADRVAELQTATGDAGMVTDVTHLYAGFALAGPALFDVVSRLTSWDPSTLAVGQATGAPIADVRAIVVRREAAVPLMEVYVAMEFARYVWRSIIEEAEPLGGCPVGWDVLRDRGWR